MQRKFSSACTDTGRYIVWEQLTGFIVLGPVSKERAQAVLEALSVEDAPVQGTPKPFTDEELQSIYAEYPRKIGRASGLDHLRRTLKTRVDFEECRLAAMSYARYCLERNTEEKFIKHFSTWVKRWRDNADSSEQLAPSSTPQGELTF